MNGSFSQGATAATGRQRPSALATLVSAWAELLSLADNADRLVEAENGHRVVVTWSRWLQSLRIALSACLHDEQLLALWVSCHGIKIKSEIPVVSFALLGEPNIDEREEQAPGVTLIGRSACWRARSMLPPRSRLSGPLAAVLQA